MSRFIVPDENDERCRFASEYLEGRGFHRVKQRENADFVLLGVNPNAEYLEYSLPVFAGNVGKEGIFDYTKREDFALKNAFLTAEGALALAVSESDTSLINAKIILLGYGRIGKALHRYLTPLTNRITVCARSNEALTLAESLGAKTMSFDSLKAGCEADYVFNTVPHPVLGTDELKAMDKDALLLDLASFPGGADVQMARHLGLRLIVARGLPGRFSPAAAGQVVGETVEKMIREGLL